MNEEMKGRHKSCMKEGTNEGRKGEVMPLSLSEGRENKMSWFQIEKHQFTTRQSWRLDDVDTL